MVTLAMLSAMLFAVNEVQAMYTNTFSLSFVFEETNNARFPAIQSLFGMIGTPLVCYLR